MVRRLRRALPGPWMGRSPLGSSPSKARAGRHQVATIELAWSDVIRQPPVVVADKSLPG